MHIALGTLTQLGRKEVDDSGSPQNPFPFSFLHCCLLLPCCFLGGFVLFCFSGSGLFEEYKTARTCTSSYLFKVVNLDISSHSLKKPQNWLIVIPFALSFLFICKQTSSFTSLWAEINYGNSSWGHSLNRDIWGHQFSYLVVLPHHIIRCLPCLYSYCCANEAKNKFSIELLFNQTFHN